MTPNNFVKTVQEFPTVSLDFTSSRYDSVPLPLPFTTEVAEDFKRI